MNSDAVVREICHRMAALGAHRDEPVLIACSGGRDSVALVSALHDARWGERCTIYYLDHGIQEKSQRTAERAVVETVAQRCGMPLVVDHCPPGSLAEEARRSGASLEALARTRRYTGLAEAAHRRNIRTVVTAHHRDDQVETILLRMCTGRSPLDRWSMAERRSIAPPGHQEIAVIRPALHLSAEALAGYARERDLPWHVDEGNRSSRYLRNRIRHTLLPALHSTFPEHAPGEALLALASHLEVLHGYLDGEVEQILHGDASRWHDVPGRHPRSISLPRKLVEQHREVVLEMVVRKAVFSLTADTRFPWEGLWSSLKGALVPVFREGATVGTRDITVELHSDAIIVTRDLVPYTSRGYLVVLEDPCVVHLRREPHGATIPAVVRKNGDDCDTLPVLHPVEPPVVLRNGRTGDYREIRKVLSASRGTRITRDGVARCAVVEDTRGIAAVLLPGAPMVTRRGVQYDLSGTSRSHGAIAVGFVFEEWKPYAE